MLLKNKNHLVKILIGFRIGLSAFILSVFNKNCRQIDIVNNFNLQIQFSIRYLYTVLFFFKKHSILLFNILTDITCLEILNSKLKYLLIYSVLNIQNNLRIFLKIKTNENNNMLSITSLFSTANWMEREIFDFFGLFFLFNKDLRRLLLDYGFQGYPLRKNFPLSGFIEVVYNDTIKKITYPKVNITQEYRLFFYQKTN